VRWVEWARTKATAKGQGPASTQAKQRTHHQRASAATHARTRSRSTRQFKSRLAPPRPRLALVHPANAVIMGVDLEPDNLYLRQTLADKYIRRVSVTSSSLAPLHPSADVSSLSSSPLSLARPPPRPRLQPRFALSAYAPRPAHHLPRDRPTSLDQSFVDFDSVRYHLSTPERKTQLVLSMDVPCWQELKQYGARDVLEREYGSRLLPEAQTEDGYSLTLVVDLEQGPPEGGASLSLALPRPLSSSWSQS